MSLGVLIPGLGDAVGGPVAGPTTRGQAITTSVGRKPLLCRTNVHHSWELAHTADGQRYVRCGKCLKERNSGPGGNVTGPGAMSAGSTSGVSGGGFG